MRTKLITFYTTVFLSAGFLYGFYFFQKGEANLASNDESYANDVAKDWSDKEEVTKFKETTEKAKDGTITNVEGFINDLPPSLRSYYTYVYNSRSLQEGSFENPRAIVFSPNGRVIYSFNGESHQQGYNAIESVIFDEQKKEFEFREIDFSPEAKRRVSVVNPNKCLGCHATQDYKITKDMEKNAELDPDEHTEPSPFFKPHPLWDTYFLWPGVYGSVDDCTYRNIEGPNCEYKLNNAAISEEEGHKLDIEYIKFNEFLSNIQTHPLPRYKLLEKNQAIYRKQLRPNLFLNDLIVDMMTQFISHQVMSYPFIKEHIVEFTRLAFDADIKFHGPTDIGVDYILSKCINDSNLDFFKKALDKLNENSSSIEELQKKYLQARLDRMYNIIVGPEEDEEKKKEKIDQLNMILSRRSTAGMNGIVPDNIPITALLKSIFDANGYKSLVRSWSIDTFPRSYNFEVGSVHEGMDYFEQYLMYEICGKSFLSEKNMPNMTKYFDYIEHDMNAFYLQDFNIDSLNKCLSK